jgi:MFS family permease
MTILLSVTFSLSLCIILVGFLADRSAVKAKINGANGLPVLVALIVSFLASLIVAAISGILGNWSTMGWIVLLTIPYHIGLAAFLIWRLQSLATRISEMERKAREHWQRPKTRG